MLTGEHVVYTSWLDNLRIPAPDRERAALRGDKQMTVVVLAAFAAVELGGQNSSRDSWLGFGFQDGHWLSLCRIHQPASLCVVTADGHQHEITAGRGVAPEADVHVQGAESIRELLVDFANLGRTERFLELMLLSGPQPVCTINRKVPLLSPVHLTWHLPT